MKHLDTHLEFCNENDNEALTHTNSCLKMTKNRSHKKFKSIRFADTLGHDLTHIKYFQDELPKIPLCAYKNLEGIDPNDFKSHPHYSPTNKPIITPTPLPPPSLPSPTLLPMFILPPISPLHSSQDQGVCLESLDTAGPLVGTARGTNLHPEKLVVARWTTDGWNTHADVEASFISGSG